MTPMYKFQTYNKIDGYRDWQNSTIFISTFQLIIIMCIDITR